MSDDIYNITDASSIPGLEELWAETLGDPRISVAVLDGRVDRRHPCFAGANLSEIRTLASEAGNGAALRHGTHVASVIFGNHEGGVRGIAPFCRGIIAPVFRDTEGGIAFCPQLDLARAIIQATEAGANVINISGGESLGGGMANPYLADAVRKCSRRGVIIVAAAGNNGCDCVDIPAYLADVIAVGAMNREGKPMAFSNRGKAYQSHGILAPGENISGAMPGGGISLNTGTSYATPIVSGVAALLLSLQLKYGIKPSAKAVRDAILGSATGCGEQETSDCRPLLAGRLNIIGAMNKIIEQGEFMKNRYKTNSTSFHTGNSIGPSGVTPSSDCGCGGSGGECRCSKSHSHAPELVFALGTIDYDFGTEARADSIMQHMKPEADNPYDPEDLLAYLDENPHEAASIIWTLSLDDTPIYAIEGSGAFGGEVYKRLREFLAGQCGCIHDDTESEDHQHEPEIDRVSIAGYITGKATLSTGQTVPVISAELRGMYGWNTEKLITNAIGESPADDDAPESEKEEYMGRAQAVRAYLERVYYEYRNLGLAAEDRAINYTVTNILQSSEIIIEAFHDKLALDVIEASPSSICRPDSICLDVKFYFFDPENTQKARKVYLQTVDVSDVVPVYVGDVRSWSIR